jgi:hypothetical protein
MGPSDGVPPDGTSSQHSLMMQITLERFAYSPWGTFGRLYLPEFRCYTVERPWLGNKPRESCIPEGAYGLRRSRFNRGGYTAYEVLDVPDRSLIKIHIGNTMDDVIGCIAPGKHLGWVAQKWAVTSSRLAFRDFMRAMENAEHGSIIISFSKP